MVSYDDWLLQYYVKNDLHNVGTIGELKKEIQNKNRVLVADESFYTDIKKSSLDFKVVRVFKNYRITKLTADFFYYKTREKVLSHNYLIEVKTFANKE